MKYIVGTEETSFKRVASSSDISLRVQVTGDYPVRVVEDGKKSAPYISGQSFFISTSSDPLILISDGGQSSVEVFKQTGHGEVESDFNGVFATNTNIDKEELLSLLPFHFQGKDVIFNGNVKANNLVVSDKYLVGDALLTGSAIDSGVRKYISNLESKIALLEYRITKLESK